VLRISNLEWRGLSGMEELLSEEGSDQVDVTPVLPCPAPHVIFLRCLLAFHCVPA